MPTTTYDLDLETQLDIIIERDRDLTVITRRGHYLPEALADIGGLAVLLVAIVRFLLGLWTNKYIDRYMVSQLFKIKRSEDDQESNSDKSEAEPIASGEFGLCQAFYEAMVFKSNLKSSDRDFHAIVTGREKLKKETNILKIIQ